MWGGENNKELNTLQNMCIPVSQKLVGVDCSVDLVVYACVN